MIFSLILGAQLGTVPLSPTSSISSSVPPSDLETYERPVPIEQLPLDALSPANPIVYVSLRQGFGPGGPQELLASHGVPCGDASDPIRCRAALDAAIPGHGFQYACLPLGCFKYLVFTRGNEVGVITDAAEMRAFLGTIDNRTEALLLVAAHGFFWGGSERIRGAIRDGADFFDLIVTRLTRFCAPVEQTGYAIRVRRSGELEERSQWIIERQEGVCI